MGREAAVEQLAATIFGNERAYIAFVSETASTSRSSDTKTGWTNPSRTEATLRVNSLGWSLVVHRKQEMFAPTFDCAFSFYRASSARKSAAAQKKPISERFEMPVVEGPSSIRKE